MMARNANVPFKGRIQKPKTYHLQIITFGVQWAAGPYRRVIRVGKAYTSKRKGLRCQTATSCAFGDKALFWQVSKFEKDSGCRARRAAESDASLTFAARAHRLAMPAA
jgi:hypothetical protein